MIYRKNILIGSGIAALGFLENYKKKIDIFEKNKYFGGHAYSHKIKNNFFDEGAHISHTKNKFFIKKIINKSNFYIIKKSKIFNYYKFKKMGYPIQFSLKGLNFYEKLFSFLSLFSLLFKFKIKTQNYHEWCNNNFGNYLSNKFYYQYTLKYWRTDPRLMRFDWSKKRILKKNIFESILSIFFNVESKLIYTEFKYPKEGGFFSFFKKNYDAYKINTNHKLKKIDLEKKLLNFQIKKIKYKKLFSTIPLTEYPSLVKNMPIKIKNENNKLKYTKCITFNFKIKNRKKITDHWCYFYDKNIEASRMTLLSNIKSSSEKYYIGQIEVFRRNDEKFSQKQIKKNVLWTINKFFKLKKKTDIIFFKPNIVEFGYPVPLIDNNEDKIINWLKRNDIISFGLYGTWEFMWTDESYLNGKLFGKKF